MHWFLLVVLLVNKDQVRSLAPHALDYVIRNSPVQLLWLVVGQSTTAIGFDSACLVIGYLIRYLVDSLNLLHKSDLVFVATC